MVSQAEVKKMSQKFIALPGKIGLAPVAMVAWLILLSFCRSASASDLPVIFPLPQEIELLENHFNLDEQTSILLPTGASEKDRFLARFLVAELSDRYGLAVKTAPVSRLPTGQPFILIGSIANPLVRQYCAERRLAITAQKPGPEGYFLQVDERAVVIAGSDERGAFYGLQSLRQLIEKRDQALRIRGARVRDWPYKPFRGVKLFLPGRENIPFFKRFVRDFMALNKYNRVILEMNAGMRLERHPELNAGWIEFAKDLNYSRRDRPRGPGAQFQNSAHHDTADGGVLEKEEVADLAHYSRQHYIEVTPELPSLSHGYYLLTRHRELAEIQNAEWPDTYCPSNPKSYQLLFDVLDEYLAAVKPRMVHLGRDEWRMPLDVCPRCRGKSYAELFIQDLNRIYGYLNRKGVRVALWGDHLLESVNGKGPRTVTSPTSYTYQKPGALSPTQAQARIPKDILIFNWFWSERDWSEDEQLPDGWGEANGLKLEGWGFKQVYGNFTPQFRNYGRRSARPSVLGGAPSSWVATTEFNLGKDSLYEFLGCANMLWSKHWPTPDRLVEIVQSLMPAVRRNLSGKSSPSEDGDQVIAIPIESYFNSAARIEKLGVDLSGLKTGRVGAGKKLFELVGAAAPDRNSALVVETRGEQSNLLPDEAQGIQIGEDASSLIFLHACARPAANDWVYRYIYNADDTADLLGWYEVIYEDGFVATIPIRYRVNILEWDWKRRQDPTNYCYGADAVACSRSQQPPITFFAFEWTNPRFGKVVKEIRLKGSVGFRNTQGKVIPGNAVILAALSVVKKRGYPEPIRAK